MRRRVGGRARPRAESARLAAGRGAERRRKRLPSCSTSVSVSESRSAMTVGQDATGAVGGGEMILHLLRQHEREEAARPRGRGSFRRAGGRSAASRTDSWRCGTPADKSLVDNKGYRRFLANPKGDGFSIDRAKVEEDAKFDNVFVLRTSGTTLSQPSPIVVNNINDLDATTPRNVTPKPPAMRRRLA